MNAAYVENLNRVVAVRKRVHTPTEAYAAVDAAVQTVIGHGLFTVLYVAPGGEEVARVYSSNPAAYPLAGRKRMGPTPWGASVIREGLHYVGRNDDDIRWAFPDHALIASLGLGSVINIAVAQDGRVVGTLNILDRAGAYDASQVALIEPFGALLAPLLADAGRAEQTL
jgi:GAF domain-containing protein